MPGRNWLKTVKEFSPKADPGRLADELVGRDVPIGVDVGDGRTAAVSASSRTAGPDSTGAALGVPRSGTAPRPVPQNGRSTIHRKPTGYPHEWTCATS